MTRGRSIVAQAILKACGTASACVFVAAMSTAGAWCDTEETLRNRYACGLMPWHRSLRDVNLCTGNLLKSFADIRVSLGTGSGLALQRTYNSNDAEEGPFGIGWQHSYNVRVEEADPCAEDSVAVRTDKLGGRHDYSREADGTYEPPVYDLNLTCTLSGEVNPVTGKETITSDEEIDENGTIKRFAANGGQRLCTLIEDRVGNRTEFSYDQTIQRWVRRPNPTTGNCETVLLSQQSLSKVTAKPAGGYTSQCIEFSWANIGTVEAPHWRITAATAPLQSVSYTYYTPGGQGCTQANAYQLKQVILDPAAVSRTTTFDYTSVTAEEVTETGLLSLVKDGLQHTWEYDYQVLDTYRPEIWVESVAEPATGVHHVWTIYPDEGVPDGKWVACVGNGEPAMAVHVDSLAGARVLRVNPGYMQAENDVHSYQFYYDLPNNPFLVTRTMQEPYTPARFHEYPDEGEGASFRGHEEYAQETTHSSRGKLLTTANTDFPGEQTTYTYWKVQDGKYCQQQSFEDAYQRVKAWDYYPNSPETPIGSRGNLMTVTDASGVTRYTYNQAGQLETVTRPGPEDPVVLHNYYDAATGFIIRTVEDEGVPQDHLNRTTYYGYFDEEQAFCSGFDAAGRLTDITDSQGRRMHRDYDSIGQMTALTLYRPDGSVEEATEYDYAANGRLEGVTASMRNGAVIFSQSLLYEDELQPSDPSYGLNDRVHQVTDTFGAFSYAVTYRYGLAGELREKQFPSGLRLTYQYHPFTAQPWYYLCCLPKDDPDSIYPMLSRLTVWNGENAVAMLDYNFDWFGRLRECRLNLDAAVPCYGGGQTPELPPDSNPCDPQIAPDHYLLTQYCPDGELDEDDPTPSHYWTGRVRSLYHWTNEYGGHERQLAENIYSYGLVGERLHNIVSGVNASTRDEAYGYDDLYRVNAVDYGDQQSSAWWYDAAGNRHPAAGVDWTYDALNRLTNANGQAVTYSSALGGNMVSGGGTGRVNTWDGADRLMQTVYGNNTPAFAYGPDGLRRTATVNGVTTSYALDGQNAVEEYDVTNPSTPALLGSYVYGPRGPECKLDANGNLLYWFLYDGHGNKIAEVTPDGVVNPDGNGDETTITSYDIWGSPRNSLPHNSPLQYCASLGHPTEANTGLIYMRARYYDPVLGRFMAEDPARNGENWYAYAGGNPVGAVDPDGNFTLGDVAATWAVVGDATTAIAGSGVISGTISKLLGGHFWEGFAMGAITATAGLAWGCGGGAAVGYIVGDLDARYHGADPRLGGMLGALGGGAGARIDIDGIGSFALTDPDWWEGALMMLYTGGSTGVAGGLNSGGR